MGYQSDRHIDLKKQTNGKHSQSSRSHKCVKLKLCKYTNMHSLQCDSCVAKYDTFICGCKVS